MHYDSVQRNVKERMTAGMERLHENLSNAFRSGRPAQGYIIVGPVYGEGTELAQWIGTQLIGQLSTVAEHAHPDMPWFEPEKKSRIIDVEMMRERILPMAQQSALSGGWKIPVIVSADRMKAEAANAFLKTLEEPPPRTLFLLLADSLTEMLPTIVSRCQVIQVGGVRKLDEPWRSQVLEMLSGIREKSVFLDTARAELLTAVLDEMMARAEKVVREERKDRPVEDDEDTLKALVGAKAKGWRNDLLLTIEQWMQDLVRMKVAPDTKETTLNFPEFQKVLMARAGHHSLARLLENLTMLEQLTVHLERNISPAQVLPYWMDRFYF